MATAIYDLVNERVAQLASSETKARQGLFEEIDQEARKLNPELAKKIFQLDALIGAEMSAIEDAAARIAGSIVHAGLDPACVLQISTTNAG